MNVLKFGPFRLDPAGRTLEREGEPVPLTPKVYETLVALIRARERVVTKAELMQTLWPDAVVEENNLTQQISALRKALGERADEARYVRTVPGHGYRFVAPVEEVAAVETRPPLPAAVTAPRPRSRTLWIVAAAAIGIAVVAGWWIMRPRTSHIQSIAVLPFKSVRATDEYLGLGMADVLITRLSNVHGITVRPTTAVRTFEHRDVDPLTAGRELQVDSVLEGTIQQLGSQIRVSLRLWNIREKRAMWGETFDDKFTSVFAVEDSIAQKMANALALRLSDAERRRLTRRYTENPEAHRLYLKGVYFSRMRTVEGFEKARDAFQRAIALDPAYALAYAGLSDAYYRESTVHLPLREAMAKARAAATTALQLDDSVAEAHTSLAAIEFHYDWNFTAGEREFQRAIALNPNELTAHQWYSEYLTAMGRVPESVAQAKVAQQIDPLAPEVDFNLGLALLFGGRVNGAITELRQSVDAHPDFWLTRAFLAWAEAEAGENDAAVADYEKARALDPNPDVMTQFAALLVKIGRRGEAQMIVDDLVARSQREYVSPFYLAAGYVALGNRDRGMEWLQKAYDERSDLLVYLNVAPNFRAMKSDPRFVDLMRRIGLVR